MPDRDTLQRAKAWLDTPQPPALGPQPRAGVTPPSVLHAEVAAWSANAKLPSRGVEAIRTLVLLWHDHLDAAHTICQDLETRDGSYLHAIVHRREPDYSNARYWLRRVGEHPCFELLAQRASSLLANNRFASLADRLIPRGRWDPVAFVAACEIAAKDAGSKQVLEEIQAAEFGILLEFLVNS